MYNTIMYMYMYILYMYMYIALHCILYVLMRDEEGRNKEASKIKQRTKQSNTAHQRKMSYLGHVYTCTWYMYILMRDEEKKQARSNKQQSKITQHTQGSHFSKQK